MEGKEVEYIDVLSDSEKLNTMLTHTEGKRQVPVIVEGNQVTIGFNGSY
jgi:glutaredoxin|tara:strand:+ start:6232 stop:6378 length:147 start_codon:yes stop_codon:yes gene_type:complete